MGSRRHGSASYQLSGRQAVIEKAKHRITVGAESIGYERPAMGRGMRITHQLWEATANGTATR